MSNNLLHEVTELNKKCLQSLNTNSGKSQTKMIQPWRKDYNSHGENIMVRKESN